MSLLRTGRRRSKQDGSYNGPARQGPVRLISPASLNLERVHEQNRINSQKQDSDTAPAMAPGPAAKGKPRLMLMGQRRSGKSSISSVVFHKMPPAETLFLESTPRDQKDNMHSFMDFQVWDMPGQIDFLDPTFDLDVVFGEMGALIWVIDAQDDYLEAVSRLTSTILNLMSLNYTSVNVEVFIHKVDGLSDDYKLDIQRDIMQRIQDELSDHGIENAPVNFHLTSIYNHSIFEAFSKVIQKLIPHLPTLEALLNNLCRACGFEKTYLFDVLSKIYIATDSSPVDMPSYELCSDLIDVIVDISEIYNFPRPAEYLESLTGPPWNKSLEDQVAGKDAEATLVLSDGRRPVMLREVNRYLCLVMIGREGGMDGEGARWGVVGENVTHTVKGLGEAFEITRGRGK